MQDNRENKTADTAETLLKLFMQNTNSVDKSKADVYKNEISKSVTARQINALKAAIPYIDYEYRKGIFMIVKLLEYKNFTETENTINMQSKATKEEYGFLKYSKMADDVRHTLNEEERKEFDKLFKLFMLKNILGGKYGK